MRRPDAGAVEQAAAEFDRLGRDEFMAKYGFTDRNTTYLVEIGSRRYPSKAIFGAAFAYMPNGEARNSETCNGTEARQHLARLGFTIVSGASRADRIRDFVITNFIDPARQRGEPTIDIVSADVHSRMGLENDMPSVCQALEGRRFAEQARVRLIDRYSPIGSDRPSSTIRYRFSLGSEDVPSFDLSALQELKRRFLDVYPDFEECGNFQAAAGSYQAQFRSEVDELLRAVEGSDRSPGAVLDRLLASSSRTSRLANPPFFNGDVVWRLPRARGCSPARFDQALAQLIAGQPAAGEAVEAFTGVFWQLLQESGAGNTYRDTRVVPSTFLAAVDPANAISIRYMNYAYVCRQLTGEMLFANAPMTAREYEKALSLAKGLAAEFERWGWKPADLWDVHGFVLAATARTETSSDPDPSTVWMVTSLWGKDDGVDWFISRSEWSLLADTGSANNRRVSEMQVGDRIFLKDFVPRATDFPFDAGGGIVTANRFRAEGTITEASEDGVRVGVEWKLWDEPRTWYFYTNNNAVWRLRDPGESIYADRLRRFLLDGEPQDHALFLNDPFWRDRLFGAGASDEMPTMRPTNLILYGPPGTGKTYRTAQEAVRLCGETAPDNRDELMQLYEELSKEGRIRFVTFHQSFSYEEFVEGLRPETAPSDGQESQGGGFRLEPRPGIFRVLCAVAGEAAKGAAEPGESFDFAGRNFWKMGLGQIGVEDSVYDACIAGDYVALGWGGDVDWSDARFASLEAIRAEWARAARENEQPSNVTQLHPFRNTMKAGDIVIVPFGNKAFRAVGEVIGDYYFAQDGDPTYYHRRRVRWLKVLDEALPLDTIIEGDFMQRTFYSIASGRVNKEALARLVRPVEDEKQSPLRSGAPQQFVLIIDEINRANVSKVFGELITLIEPDKRLGMPNALKVRLPYSKREFGVPANLHIIGTMNTADRSIALLDTALRRRFRFEEMAPDTSVPAFLAAENSTGLPLGDVLNSMNRRIEYLVDRDHRIGHAFFIGCKTKEDVDAVMRDKVIPLLQEYFFDDWNRLAAVLGEKDKGGNFLTCETIEDPMAEGGEPLKSWWVRSSFDEGAYTRLLSARPASPTDLEGEA